MKTPALLTVFLGASCYAQDPTKCASAGKLDGADFMLADQGDNTHLAALSKTFANAGKKVEVSDVFADGNHQMTGSSYKLAWESKPDYDDFGTSKWTPQGISSTADALEVGTYQGVDGWLVSWYREDPKSVRISFVDKATKKYRNALLVYPNADDDFKEIPIHAGGIMWYGDTLWVVDTKNGIRVFDLNNIWEVGSGDGVGKKSGGGYSAAGYKYVIPQIRWYKWTPSFSFQHSFIALDRTASPDRLLIGEYQKSDSSPIRMVQYELDYKTRKLKSDGASTSAVWAYCVGIERIQGAVSVDGAIYISRSNGASKGDIFGWVPGKAAYNNEGFVPPSPEDLSYDKRSNVIYGLTEVANGRYILTLKRSDIKTS